MGVEGKSARMVKCVKLRRELPGLEEPPWPGALGQRIYENVSHEAWELWKEHLKLILNEFRLSPWTKEAQEIIEQQMQDFFFGEGGTVPEEYVPPPKH